MLSHKRQDTHVVHRLLLPLSQLLQFGLTNSRIFFIEGIITTCFATIAFFFMPSTPADAKFLSEEERAVALARMKMDAHGSTDKEDVNMEKFDWHWVKMALLSPNTLLTSLAWFFLLIPLYVSLGDGA